MNGAALVLRMNSTYAIVSSMQNLIRERVVANAA